MEMTWRTEDEVAFLNRLGRYQKDELCGMRGASVSDHLRRRVHLLVGYLDGAAKRSDWGSMDRDRVLAHARLMLHAELAQLGSS